MLDGVTELERILLLTGISVTHSKNWRNRSGKQDKRS